MNSDRVYLGELARTILCGGTQVEQWIEVDGVMTLREPTAEVVGSGHETTPHLDSVVLRVIRVPVQGRGDGLVLRGTWANHPEPTVLATAEAS